MASITQDQIWMQKAIQLAQLAEGLTTPNPCVGAVIVANEMIIGEGYHRKAGEPHAERNALAHARELGNGDLLSHSCIYITLEPCSTYGKTPPCTDAIIESGIKRVVYGSVDPNPSHAGRAKEILEQHGIEVVIGVLKEECDYLIRAFALNITQKRSWVIAKTAMTLDGRIVRGPDKPQWITNEASRNFVHTLRAQADAIMTGGNTVRKDDPSLTIRTPDKEISPDKIQPWRVVLTHSAHKIPPQSTCLNDEHKDRTVIIENVSNYLELLQYLYEQGPVSVVLLEAGGKLVREFLNAGLIDEWIGFYAPIISGGNVFGVEGQRFLPKEAHLVNMKTQSFGDNFCVRGCVKYDTV